MDTLFDAAIAGDADAIAKLEKEADKLHRYEETILHLQSEKGNIERVRFILREFANKNLLAKLSKYKHTALHWAIYRGHTQVAEILIDAARDLPPSDDDDDNPVTPFQSFLRQGDKDMDTALHAAVTEGNLAIVKLLVEADPNDTHIQNDDGKTPMYIAVEKGFNDIAEIISTTCTAPSLLGPDCSTVARIRNIDQAKSPGGNLYKIMDKDALYAAAIARDADAIAALKMCADKLNRYKETILHTESENGNTENVRFILWEFADKNLLVKLNKYKQTALHLASSQGHTQVAEILINAARHLLPRPHDDSTDDDNPVTSFQAFVRQADNSMDTALHEAVKKGNMAIVKLLVEADTSDKHIQNDAGKTPMYIAVEQGLNDIAEVISTSCIAPSLLGPDCSTVVRNKNFDQAKSPGGTLYKIMDKDALYAAAISGDADAIAVLEMHTDKLDSDDRTILHIESMEGNTERVQFILRVFAHKNLMVKQDNQMETALTWAAYFGHTEVAKVLIDAAKNLPPSEDYSPITSFQAFLRLGDKDMDTALHVAVINDNEEIVKLLVEADPSDTHTQNNEGKTPMYIAVEKGFNAIAEIISTTCTAPSLDGPDGSTVVRIKNLEQGNSPGGTLFKIMDRYAFFVAAIAGDADAIAKLQKEADILNEGEETILHVESQNGYAERVRFILMEFAKKYLLSTLDSDEHTALHLAANNGHTEAAEILIDVARHLYPSSDFDNTQENPHNSFQAFLRQSDQYEDSALHAAVKKGHAPIVKLLVEADPSDTHIQNDEGKTPLYIAVEQGYSDIVEIISTTCTAPSLNGPNGSAVVRIKNLDEAKSPGEILYKIMDKDALYVAAISGDADAIALLEIQADKVSEYFEETILHTESENGNSEHVRCILELFADKNLLVKLNRYKQTALHLALSEGHTEVAAILIDAARHMLTPASANDNTDDNPVTSFQDFLRQADRDLDTALHIAVSQGYVDIVKLLVEADPSDPHTQNSDGETPIYIAVEKEYYEIVKMICTTRSAPLDLDAPGSTTTVLHILIKNLDQGREEKEAVIRQIIETVKHVHNHRNVLENDKRLVQFFNRTDEKGCIILELAVERNYLNMVELILAENPAFHPYDDDAYYLDMHAVEYHAHFQQMYPALMGIIPLIYKTMDKKVNDMVKLLTQAYERGIERVRYIFQMPYERGIENALYIFQMPELISAIRGRQKESVISKLKEYYAKNLVSFADNLGWTALHHAAYHEFDSVIHPIVEAQKEFRHSFVYQNKLSTPFLVAAEKGYTSTVICLIQSWPASSSAYTVVDKDEQNILHIAALQSKKEMIQGILNYCSEEYKREFVNKQDKNGDTPLHILIRRGCFIPEILRYEGLDIRVENNERWTPPDMLYFHEHVIDDQVQIKIALDGIQIDSKRDLFSSSVLPPSKRMKKDVILNEGAKRMKNEKNALIKKDAHAMANCFAEAIAGDPISRAALEMEAAILNELGETILHVESKKGDIEHVRFLVSTFAYKGLLGKLDRAEQTPLHLAAHHGHTQVVEVLIDAARRNLPSSSANDDPHNPVSYFQNFIRQANVPDRNTTLHLAVLNGYVAIVKLLVEADPNHSHVQNKEGKAPIFIAVENGYKDIIKEICMNCTALSLDGPHGRTTALHALIKNIGQVTVEANNMIKMMIEAAKGWSTAEDPSLVKFKDIFCRTDESGSTVLELAMERNYVDVVKLILLEDPAYEPVPEIKRHGIMRLIYKAMDEKYSEDIIEFLSEAYEAGIVSEHKGVLALILDIKRRDEDSVLGHLRDAKAHVTFKEDNGWTPLHYAVYHEFDSILGAIIEAQEDFGQQFVYEDLVSTPFHVAVIHGYTSTVTRLLQSWPVPSPEVNADNSPYTVVDINGRNALHLAAAADNKEMVQAILKYCPKEYKDRILEQQDRNGDTPLHLLISCGCFIPELIENKVPDTKVKNKNGWTALDMLYFQNLIVGDQVKIKVALEYMETDQWYGNSFLKSMEKNVFGSLFKKKPNVNFLLKSMKNIFGNLFKKKQNGSERSVLPIRNNSLRLPMKSESLVLPSRRQRKDVLFNESKISLNDAKEKQKKKELQRYREGNNSQIVVSALITTITFTVGFTMPGGLHQSGEVDEGSAVLSKTAAFNTFMVLDVLALLLSSCAMFIYFLESIYDDPDQVFSLHATTTGLNIVSVMLMMLIFITGTYVVLSQSPVLAITVCVIGSLFFVFVIIHFMKFMRSRLAKKKKTSKEEE